MNICNICNKDFKKLSGLRTHLNRTHHIKWENTLKFKPCKNPKCSETLLENSKNVYHSKSCHVSHQQTLKWEKYRTDDKFKSEYNTVLNNNNMKKYGVKWSITAPCIKSKSKLTNNNKSKEEKEAIQNKIKYTKFLRYGNINAYGYGSLEFKSNLLKTHGSETYNNSNKAMETYVVRHGGIGYQIKENLNKSINTKKLQASERFKSYLEYIKLTEIENNKYKCNVCGFEFCVKNEARYPICYRCNPHKGTSKFEKDVLEFIISLNIDDNIHNRYRYLGKHLELDIFLEKRNIAIELNGNYYHSELSGNKTKMYHLNKTNLCESKGIRLIHIFEDEWKLKPDIVKARLTSILKCNISKSIYARKCIIREINTQDKNKFLDTYHLQGIDNSSIRLGAFYNNVLVSVMTFGKLRRIMGLKNSNSGIYELYRYASSQRVVGIASKFLHYFIINYNPSSIISYADRRWSDGNLYYKLGFTLKSKTQPNYWYVNRTHYLERMYRFNFRKSVLKDKLLIFDIKLTEWENMSINGYDRIWDCGHLKFEMNI